MTQKLIALLAASLVGGLALSQAHAADISLQTAVARYEVAPRERVLDGRVEAVQQATVSAQTSGRVAELPFDVNDFVDAGSVIMRFTDTEQRAALQSAEAAQAEARARLANAEQEYERASRMIENNTISQAQYDQVRANRDSARARRDAAIAGVEAAKEQLEYTVVRAPYAGIVSERHVELGELVSPGQPLISGLSLQMLRVNVDVPQSLFHSVRTIAKAFVYVEDQRVEAESLTFFPVADDAANTFRVRVNLPAGAVTLYPGMITKVGFVVGETERLLIPADAVVRRSELSAVYVVSDDDVALRQVRLGRRYGDDIEILAGLSSGEQVAMDAVQAGIKAKEQAD